jgi:hypothetical protein
MPGIAKIVICLALVVNREILSAPTGCKNDVVILIDNSGSISALQSGEPNYHTDLDPHWIMMQEFSKQLASQFTVGPDADHIAAVDFGNDGYEKWDLNKYTDQAAVEDAFLHIPFLYQGTNTAAGFEKARAILTDPAKGARGPEVNKIIIIITDGNPNQPVDVATGTAKFKEEVAKIHDAGIRLVAVGVTAGVDAALLQGSVQIASDYVQASSFDDLKNVQISAANCASVVTTTTSAPTSVQTETGGGGGETTVWYCDD